MQCTRSTFDPVETICSRLRLNAQIQETTSAAKAAANLTAALAGGRPAIVWADIYSLRYSALPEQGIPGMIPIVVYGYDEASGLARIADRACVPLTATAGELATARARQSSVKNRLMTLEPPANFDHLPAAVAESIRACVSLFADKPPKGPKANFGLAALKKWADLLTNARDNKGWPQLFPPGAPMYAALRSTFELIETRGTGGAASRPQYADFLDEAATILGVTALHDVAAQFRASAEHWHTLARALLPDAIAPFKETRELLLRASALFAEHGAGSLDERRQIHEWLGAIKDTVAVDFPLTIAEAAAMRDELRQRVLELHDVEERAVIALREVIGRPKL